MTSVEDTGVEMEMDQISCQMATLGMSGECQVTFLLGHSDTNTYTTLGARGANMKTTGREEQDDCPAPQDDCRGVGGGWKGLPGLSSSFTLLWAMSSQRYRKLCPGLGMIEPEQLPRAHQLRPLECGVTDGLRHKQLDPQVTHTGLTEQHQRGHIPCPELRHHLNRPMMAHVATPACDTEITTQSVARHTLIHHPLRSVLGRRSPGGPWNQPLKGQHQDVRAPICPYHGTLTFAQICELQ